MIFLEVATQTLVGSVDIYVTGLRVQSKIGSTVHATFVSSPKIRDPPKGIPWLRTRQHPRVTIRSSLLSLVSWKKVRGSTCGMKNYSIFNIQHPAVKVSPYINLCSLLWVPVPNHQVSGHNRFCEALAKDLEHILGRLGSLCTDRLNHLREDR